MSVGFPKWDGYEVYNDPTFTAYVGVSPHGEGGIDAFDFLIIIVITGGITSSVVVAVVLMKIKKKRKNSVYIPEL
jgi:preprotein translocase subunit SecF